MLCLQNIVRKNDTKTHLIFEVFESIKEAFKKMDEQINLKRELEKSNDEASKRLKNDLTDESEVDKSENETLTKLTLYENANLNLSLIKLKQIIDIRFAEKSAILEGEYEKQRVLIFIEKLPFDEDTIRMLFNETFELTKIVQNDIYGSYSADALTLKNKIKATIVCPATDKHFEKYKRSQWAMIEETPARYQKITLAYLEENKFSIDWVYNILEHKQEVERIVFENEDSLNGFILLPDLKMPDIKKGDEKAMRRLYLVAIVRRRDLKSIRDLTGSHLQLLTNIKTQSCKVIKEKYGIDRDKLQIYFHYQPSYYHLHIHFNTIYYEHPRLYIASSHLLETVITNLEIDSNYYKKATLTFRLKCSSSLSEYYQKKLHDEDCKNEISNGEDKED